MKKRYIALSALLIIVGLALCTVALCLSGFRFLDMFDGDAVQKTYEIVSDITSINIKDLDSDVVIRKSADGISRIVYYDNNRYTTAISEENSTLTISSDYDGKWYNYIGVMNSDKDTVIYTVIYLAKDKYDALYIDSDTCDIKNAEGVSFNTVKIDISTGDVELSNMVTDDLDIKTSTGKISLYRVDVKAEANISTSTGNVYLNGISARKTNISVSSGEVEFRASTIDGPIKIESNTGDVELYGVECVELDIKTSTGNVELTDVYSHTQLKLATKIEVSSGKIELNNCKGWSFDLKSSSGDITGYFTTDVVFVAQSSSGSIKVPESNGGGTCRITTSSGDIEFYIVDGD